MTFTHRYPSELKDEKYDAALNRLRHSSYSEDDRPHRSTQHYVLNTNYEKADIEAKRLVDTVGAADNAWWMQQWKENNL